jgi:hypothetical protein
MLLARGDPARGRAQDLVREAIEAFRELGMEEWARRAGRLEQPPS